MEKRFLEIFEQVLSSILGVISDKVGDTEICVVNDNLKDIRVIKGQLEEGLELKCVRKLDPDEMKLFVFLKLQEVALKSNSRHISMLENLSESVIEQLLDLHFLGIITSNEIKANIIGFTISQGFWLYAVMKKNAMPKNLRHRLDEQERRVLNFLPEVFEALDEIYSVRQKINDVEMLQSVADFLKKLEPFDFKSDKGGEKKSDMKDGAMRPFALKRDVVNFIQEVHGGGGSFVSTEKGWLAQGKNGKYYPYPIPFSEENDKIILTFYPGLRK